MKIFIRKKTFNVLLAIFGVALIIGLSYLLLASNRTGISAEAGNESVITEDGKQIMLMDANAGYTPNSFTVKAGVESVLRVTTNNTFDCSAFVSIPSLSIRRSLPITGITDIDLGSQPAGTTLRGMCSMAMYRFTIKFI